MQYRTRFRSKTGRKLVVALGVLATVLVTPGPAIASDYSTSPYWTNATRAHDFTNASSPAGLWFQPYFNGDGAYKTTTTDTRVFNWGQEANLGTAAQMLLTTGSASGAGAPYLAKMNAIHTSYNHLWDYNYVNGGFMNGYQSSSKFGDENCIAGIAFMDAYDALGATGGSQVDKDSYLNAAKATATFMLGQPGYNSDLWNYDPLTAQGHVGGFWWATIYDDANDGVTNTNASFAGIRSTEVNANCAILFARLYQRTSISAYLTAAQTTMNWLNSYLRDSVSGLYYWGFWDKEDTSSSEYTHHSKGLDKNKFAYDQSFVIEADLAMVGATSSGFGSVSGSYRTDAENLADALVNPSNGLWTTNTITTNGSTYYPGFIERKGWTTGALDIPANTTFADNKSISPVFTGWVSEALIQLYNYEHGQASPAANAATWLSVAKNNIDTLNTLMQTTPTSGQYFYKYGPNGSGNYVATSTDIAATSQAYMEKFNAMLAPLYP